MGQSYRKTDCYQKVIICAGCPIFVYGKLSARLRELGLTQNDLAYALNLSPGPVSQRMQGDVAWNIEEMYRTMELCRISPEEMHIYFPDPTTTKKRGIVA